MCAHKRGAGGVVQRLRCSITPFPGCRPTTQKRDRGREVQGQAPSRPGLARRTGRGKQALSSGRAVLLAEPGRAAGRGKPRSRRDGEEGRARPDRAWLPAPAAPRSGAGARRAARRPGTCASSAQRRRPRRPQGLLLGEEAARFVLLLIDRAGAVRTTASGAGPTAALRRAGENATSAAPTSTGTGSSVEILGHTRPGTLKRFERGGDASRSGAAPGPA